jgi:hypothetical protein
MKYVYGLFDDMTHDLFYVGQTSNIAQRFAGHRNSTMKDKRDNCYIEILEEGETVSNEDELFWIQNALFLGCRLTNKIVREGQPRSSSVPRKKFNTGKSITKLKDVRESRFMNIMELAEQANVSIGVISRSEHGERISFGSIKKLAKALGVAPDKLL